MPELTVTPDPESRPPSVRVRVDADEDTLITRAEVRRDGEIVRGQVADRTPRLVIDDYEMPYATEVEYSVEGESVPTDVPLLDEVWGDLAEWDGDTGDWVLPEGTHPVAVNLVTDPFMDDGAYWEVSYLDFPSPDFDTSVPSELVSTPVEMVSGSTVYDVNAVGCVVDSGQGDQFWVNIDARSDFGGYVLLAYWGLDSSGGTVEGGSLLASAPSDGAWHTLSAPFTVSDASVVSAAVYLTHYGAPGTVGDLHVRHPILTRGSDPADFFTGDTDDTARWTYEWSGTPGESTSLKFDNDLTELLSTDVDDSAIEHTTDVPFNTVTVNNPLDVMVELIEVTEGESGEETSVAVTIRSTGSGTTVQCHTSGTVRTNGGGTYTASIMDGTLEVSGDAWTLSQPCTSTPSRVRITAMPDGYHYLGSFKPWEMTSEDRLGVSSDALFVLDYHNGRVERYDYDGNLELDWSLPGQCTDIDVCNWKQHVWLTDLDNQQIHEYEQDGTLVRSISLQSPLQVTADSLLAVTWATNQDQPVIYLAYTRNNRQLIRYVDRNGTMRGQVGERATWATRMTAPGDDLGDMWASIPDFDVVRYYRYKIPWSVGSRGEWTSRAVSVAVSPEGESSNGWQKFELWDDRVREVEGVGKYTGRSWPLNGPGRDIVAPLNGECFFTIEGNHVSRYGPLAEVGQTVLRAIDAQTGEGFTLSATVTLDAEGAWLIHASRPTALSVRIDRGQHRYDHEGVNVAGVSASEKTSESNVTVHHAPGAEYAVVNRFGNRPKPTWTLSLQTETWAARDDVSALLKDQQPVLFRAPADWQWDLPDGWYSVGEVSDKARVDTRADLEGRLLELPLTAVKRPAVIVSPSWTYNSVLLEFGSLEALEQSGVSWLELLLGDV